MTYYSPSDPCMVDFYLHVVDLFMIHVSVYVLYMGSYRNHLFTLVFQIPCCVDVWTHKHLQNPRRFPNTDPHKVFGGFWKTRVTEPKLQFSTSHLHFSNNMNSIRSLPHKCCIPRRRCRSSHRTFANSQSCGECDFFSTFDAAMRLLSTDFGD